MSATVRLWTRVSPVRVGFLGRPRASSPQLPPGQYLTPDFPVLSAGPTPRVPLDGWEFTITTESGQAHRWSWDELMELPSDTPRTSTIDDCKSVYRARACGGRYRWTG